MCRTKRHNDSLPRYLKEAWKATATTAEIIKVENEIEEQMLDKILNPEQRKAAEAMHKNG